MYNFIIRLKSLIICHNKTELWSIDFSFNQILQTLPRPSHSRFDPRTGTLDTPISQSISICIFIKYNITQILSGRVDHVDYLHRSHFLRLWLQPGQFAVRRLCNLELKHRTDRCCHRKPDPGSVEGFSSFWWRIDEGPSGIDFVWTSKIL